jgi:hypothetical protein
VIETAPDAGDERVPTMDKDWLYKLVERVEKLAAKLHTQTHKADTFRRAAHSAEARIIELEGVLDEKTADLMCADNHIRELEAMMVRVVISDGTSVV